MSYPTTYIESYPCYIKIGDNEESSEEFIELPTEENGTILLSTIKSQYPDASGLRYKSDTGGWRGLRLSGDVIDPPPEGWGSKEYFITLPKVDSAKRKIDQPSNLAPDAKMIKSEEIDYLSDLIVLGLPYSATEVELKTYFEQFGELAMHEIKRDMQTGFSKGFGFIRYNSVEAAKKVLASEHSVGGRRCEVRLPKKGDEKPKKLFIGRLKEGTTADHLREHFGVYGELKDVYVPEQFRGFGFVTYDSQEVARQVMDKTHIIQGSCVNVRYAEPKGNKYSSGVGGNGPDFSQYGYGTANEGGYNTPASGGYNSGYNYR